MRSVNTARHNRAVTLKRGGTLLAFEGVPAQVCTNCGEAYVSEAVTEQLLQEAEEAAREQVWVGVRELTPVPV